MTAWCTDLRKTALIVFVASLLSLLIPMWNMTQQMSDLESRNPDSRWWMISATVVLCLYTATLPAFYFVLSRNDGALRFPKRLRLLALVAALTTGVIVVAGLLDWIRSLGSYLASPMFDWSVGARNILTLVRDPRTIGQLSTLLGELANIALVLILVAVFRWGGEPRETDVPVSKLLRVMTKVAVISWGLVVAFCVIRLISMPFLFIQFRDAALKIGRKPPLLGNLMAEATRTLLSQACLLAVPYIVYRSQQDRVETLIDVQSEPEPLESGG